MAGLDAPVHGVFIRAPWVEEAGPGVEVFGAGGGQEIVEHRFGGPPVRAGEHLEPEPLGRVVQRPEVGGR